MGNCGCCQPVVGKERRRKLRLKSSKVNKQLRADKDLRDTIDEIFLDFDKNKDGYLDTTEA